MPKQDTARRTMPRKKETSLREAVVVHIGQFFELHGLDETIRELDKMKLMFSGIQDWPDIEEEVLDFIVEKKRLVQQADIERQKQMDQALLVGLAKGISGGQVNLLTGTNPQAPFYSSTPTIGGHKQ